jgi:hypothetical protein
MCSDTGGAAKRDFTCSPASKGTSNQYYDISRVQLTLKKILFDLVQIRTKSTSKSNYRLKISRGSFVSRSTGGNSLYNPGAAS